MKALSTGRAILLIPRGGERKEWERRQAEPNKIELNCCVWHVDCKERMPWTEEGVAEESVCGCVEPTHSDNTCECECRPITTTGHTVLSLGCDSDTRCALDLSSS